MKKTISCVMTLFVALVFFSCATPPPAEPAPPAPVPAAPAPPAPPPPAPPPPVAQETVDVTPRLDLTGAQQYTVVRGDTLSAIARRFFGNLTNVGNAGTQNVFFFPVIMMASDTPITDPDFIVEGTVLTIPDLRRNLDSPSGRQAIRNSLLEAADFFGRRNLPMEEEGLRRLANSL